MTITFFFHTSYEILDFEMVITGRMPLPVVVTKELYKEPSPKTRQACVELSLYNVLVQYPYVLESALLHP